MAVPLLAATFIGGLISGLVQFFASKAGAILVGAGLTLVTAKGLELIVGFMIADFNTVVGAFSGSSTHWGAIMLKFAAYCGLFDGINIVLAGYMAMAYVKAGRVFLARLAQ
ncbi:hypothetical protein CJ010_14655 [Azoarcus sp. DD4]|uniref:DUF2523 family protein n=1 Tax=Azoarcus sp. DD4 TaxID=2027405 RepID=UPI001127572A|nr:DUF2523 family protein [Azoarcus sp. DD4]QDF97681.1 hypothetical protein CJ010_14655 [Azoarcus sp. DD4]